MDAIQVFDSWAGTLSLADYRSYVLPHSTRVFAALAGAGVPMTHFGVGTAELLGAMSGCGGAGPCRRRGLADVADRRRQPGAARHGAAGQPRPGGAAGGLAGGERAVRAVVEDGRRAIDAGAAGHVFNLGHGVLPSHRSRCDHRRRGVGALAVTSVVLRCRRRDFGSRRGVPAAGARQVRTRRSRYSIRPTGWAACCAPSGWAASSLDVGAEAFVARRPEVPALLAELGLAGKQIGTTGARPLIYSQGRLHPLPQDTLQGIPAQRVVAGRAGRRRDDRAHGRRTHPAVLPGAAAPTRRSPNSSATGSASRW